MRVYTAHVRPAAAGVDLALIKEGFCWPAAVVPVIWALWHGLWRVLAIFLATAAAIAGVAEALATTAELEGIIVLAYMAATGTFGNDLRRWSLSRQGYRLEGVVTGPDQDSAERRLSERRPELINPEPPSRPPWPAPRPAGPSALEDGLWP
jgi:hypothetical protein